MTLKLGIQTLGRTIQHEIQTFKGRKQFHFNSRSEIKVVLIRASSNGIRTYGVEDEEIIWTKCPPLNELESNELSSLPPFIIQ